MELSLIYFTYFLFTLLSGAHQTELNIDPCPTSRRLLLFGGFKFPFGEKKPEHVSSSSKSSSSSSSSPAKYARSDNSHGLTIYIRPQTSSELGHKVRSYSHLLKTKLYTKEERARLKQLQAEKKKGRTSNKKKNATQQAAKTRDLVAFDDQERDRCRALLHIDQQNSLVPAKTTKQTKKNKKEKTSLPAKVKKVAAQAKKKVVAAAEKALPTNKKEKSIKTKNNAKATGTEKKKPSDTQPTTPLPSVKEAPTKTQTSPPPPQSTTNTKSKREKPPPVIEDSADPLDFNESDLLDNDEKNNSVVGRAYHFVKNMFQLSDDILENNHTDEEDRIVSSPNDQPHRQSRKLLSIDEHHTMNDEFNLLSNEHDDPYGVEPLDHLLLSAASISTRQLLSVKTNKRSTPSKKTTADANKPKVGWAYRYRISRYLADQKTKRSGRVNKAGTGGGKSKQQQQTHKKTSSPSHAKGSKRKLLELDSDYDFNDDEDDQTSSEEIVDTVTLTQTFVPKRQLLASKKAPKIVEEVPEEEEEDDDDDNDKADERRRIKSYDELTDPVEIVRSYDRGLFKPRVGWQFRYRVSRYIDSLRENIREDQARLKQGLQAIKRKTPQELSGRRKRVLDKPFAPEPEETPTNIDENKPNVGWRYRYRISKMLEAKRRGDYIDDDEEKRKARLDQKRKPPGAVRPIDENEDDCLEWEFDIDPELRKISEEGKRVGWAYRYRIRRKLDELKHKQADTGVPFDIETLGGKREKKTTPTAASTTVTTAEKSTDIEKKAVGWQYRYRVSKMREAQKLEAAAASEKSTSKKPEHVPPHERLDPALARLKPEERVVGWQYRYRIRRKLDALNNGTRDAEGGKRHKKTKESSAPGKRKEKEKIIKQVEESIEKILNIDDIDETPFMEYFRRSSSYVLFGLVPTARKSICLLPLPVTLSFCREDDDDTIKESSSTTETSKQSSTKKLRTKKEKRAKQFIHSRPNKLDSTDEKIDLPEKPLSKTPTITPDKVSKKRSQQKQRAPVRHDNNEQVRHFDEEEHPVKKLIGVESKKKNNKKRFQIIGKEVKAKQKHAHTTESPPVVLTTTTTTTSPPPVSTTTRAPVTTTTPPTVQIPTTTRAPITTTAPPPPPVVEILTTTQSPPPPEQPIVSTTTPAPLRSPVEIVQEEATTLFSTQTTSSEEAVEEMNEATEDLQTTTAPTLSDATDSTSSDEEEGDSDSSDDETSSNDSSESDSSEENDENFDPLAVKKMKQLYENAKESMHGVFDLKGEKDSS